MGKINYTIVSGVAPFTVKLIPSMIPNNHHANTGTFSFINVPNGEYSLIAIDSNECEFNERVIVDPNAIPAYVPPASPNLITFGNVDDENLIFNEMGTNTDVKSIGTADPGSMSQYLWFKTTSGKPLSEPQVVNYTISTDEADTFRFIGVSDSIHANVNEVSDGASQSITGQITLSVGFIESYFNYEYIRALDTSSFSIGLSTTKDIVDTNITTKADGYDYGVSYVDSRNIILDY